MLGGGHGAAERGETMATPPPDAAPPTETPEAAPPPEAAEAAPPAEAAGAAPPAAPLSIEARIQRAFDDAIAPDKEGVRPDKKTAWILFLRNASRGLA